MKLWYRKPAAAWSEALPLGNGRIGAMVFGGIIEERIALNEDTLWTGHPRDIQTPNAREVLAESRRLFDEGKIAEAEALLEDQFLGPYTESYLPLGDLRLSFPTLQEAGIADYTRELDLAHAVSRVTFTHAGTQHSRECFVSAPDEALVLSLSADRNGQIDVDIALPTELHATCTPAAHTLTLDMLCPSSAIPQYVRYENPIRYDEEPEKLGISARALLDVETVGGTIELDGLTLRVRGANSATLRFCVRTSFNGFDRLPHLEGRLYQTPVAEDLAQAKATPYETLLARHLRDYVPLYDRVKLTLADTDPALEALPTDERLYRFLETQHDDGLIPLMFQFGRYLLIASSRPGTQAANLQGIWNEHMRPPWSSNYTVNINTQMNYWPANAVNLSEMQEPLFDLIDHIGVAGRKTAQTLYGARGVVAHHNVDLWAQVTPVCGHHRGATRYAMWPMSHAWFCQHLFEHYVYTLDRAFLRDRALPHLRAACQFLSSAMQPDARGYLSIYPATSPENGYLLNGEVHVAARFSTMNDMIAREVFTNYLQTLDILGLTEEDAPAARHALAHIRPTELGPDGRILEYDKPYEESEPTHRHVSHLYALHPGHDIAPDTTPDLAEAVKKTLAVRGDNGTGWSLGWKINLWARLFDGDHALRLIKRQLHVVDASVQTGQGGGSYINLFDAHPPFQIDGNFGATAGIAQLFVQTRMGEVLLLPALPTEWPEGSIMGLRTASNCTVDVYFAQGRLLHALLTYHGEEPGEVRVRYGGKACTVQLERGTERLLTICDFL